MPPSDREAPGFAPVPPQLDLPRLEEGILAGWERNDVEGQSLRKGADAAAGRSAAPAFVFFDGPPFATGLPHYGHILAGTPVRRGTHVIAVQPVKYGDLKKLAASAVADRFADYRARKKDLMKNPDRIKMALASGGAKARAHARQTMETVLKATGLR